MGKRTKYMYCTPPAAAALGLSLAVASFAWFATVVVQSSGTLFVEFAVAANTDPLGRHFVGDR